MKESSLQIHDEKDIKVPFVHVTVTFITRAHDVV